MLFGESTSPAQAHHLLSAAADMGIHFFDSAEMYPVPQRKETQGKSESILGDWLRTQCRYHSQACSASPISLSIFMRQLTSTCRQLYVSAGQLMRAITRHWAKNLPEVQHICASGHACCAFRQPHQQKRHAGQPLNLRMWQCRDDFVIATKVAGPGSMSWLRGGPEALNASAIAEAIDASLSRLRCDYIDLYQLHWPDRYSSMASLSSKICSCSDSSSLSCQHTPRATCSATVIDLAEA